MNPNELKMVNSENEPKQIFLKTKTVKTQAHNFMEKVLKAMLKFNDQELWSMQK